MFKQVPLTDKISAQIAAAYGDPAADTTGLAVFEAVAANTKPLLRKGGLFEGAVINTSMFSDMISILDQQTHVPIEIMHGDSRDPLPVGKVFAAKMLPETDGSTSLNTMFYMSPDQTDLITRLNSGVVGEVSIGTLAKQLLCSECGFDYLGADATLDNVWGCVCANDHTIGQKGAHLKLHGAQKWSELSLVNKGAAQGAKILPRSAMRMGAALAARGLDDRMLSLQASISDTLPLPTAPAKESPDMSTEALTKLATDLALAGRDRDDAKTALTAAQAEVIALKVQVTDLTTKLATAEATDAAKVKIDLDAALVLLDEIGMAALIAQGKKDAKLPEPVSERIQLVRDARASLSLALTPGGKSLTPTTGTETAKRNLEAFTTR